MKISHEGTTVSFKTEPEELFLAEKSGAKPNTVRIIDHYERQQLKKKLSHKIIIQHGEEIFIRTVTHVHVSEMVLGKYIAIFSWTYENHRHPILNETQEKAYEHTQSLDEEIPLPVFPHSVPVEPGEHNIVIESPTSIDKLSTLLLPITLIHDLGRRRRGKSHAEFIQELLETYLNNQAYQRGSLHD